MESKNNHSQYRANLVLAVMRSYYATIACVLFFREIFFLDDGVKLTCSLILESIITGKCTI